MIERLRHFLVSSSRAALNATGTHSRGLYGAVADLSRRYELSPRDLTQFELKAFSQNGEDGVIQEITRRVGAGTHTFVEFGIGTGAEGNCVFLAEVMRWRGLFCEADPVAFASLQARYAHASKVMTVNARLTPESIESILLQAGVETEPTLLSIDVDGNDYYLWEALETIRPRIVVIEYNASLDPTVPLVQPYSAAGADGTAFFGASLAALESLARRRGYRLVHTELAGVNAFFVREDVAGDHFLQVADVPRRPPNYLLDGVRMHRPAPAGRTYAEPSGNGG
jgi:hypothetical protein